MRISQLNLDQVYEGSDHVHDACVSCPEKCHAAVGKLQAEVKG